MKFTRDRFKFKFTVKTHGALVKKGFGMSHCHHEKPFNYAFLHHHHKKTRGPGYDYIKENKDAHNHYACINTKVAT